MCYISRFLSQKGEKIMKKYTKCNRMPPCKIEKDDLYELMKIFKENIDIKGKSDLKITANLPNISITEHNIDDFLDHKELPNIIKRLFLSIIGWSDNNEIVKKIDLTFYDNYIDLYIDGADEIWVLGQQKKISNFLKNKRPWFWFFHKIIPNLLGVMFPVSIYAFVHFIEKDMIFYSISSGIFITVWIFINIFYFKSKIFPYTQIIIRDKEKFLNKENITILLALLSLITSIIGGIILPIMK